MSIQRGRACRRDNGTAGLLSTLRLQSCAYSPTVEWRYEWSPWPNPNRLDRYLPQYDVTETHAVIVEASTDATWHALRGGYLARSPVIPALLELPKPPESNLADPEWAADSTRPAAPDPKTVTVAFATGNGTAISGTDYTARSGTVTFRPGTTAEMISIAVLDDTSANGQRSFTLTLSKPANAAVGEPSAARNHLERRLSDASVRRQFPGALAESSLAGREPGATVTPCEPSSATVSAPSRT